MALNGQGCRQVAYRREYPGGRPGRADGDVEREITGMDHDLQHPGEQEVVPAQGPAPPGNRRTRLRLAARWPQATYLTAAITRLQACAPG